MVFMFVDKLILIIKDNIVVDMMKVVKMRFAI